MIHLAIRVFIGGTLESEELVECKSTANLDQLLPLYARKHAAAVGARLFMIEFEFLDEPNVNERFLRFGTDPRLMVSPVAVRLDDLVN
jgi:hypothetical protein